MNSPVSSTHLSFISIPSKPRLPRVFPSSTLSVRPQSPVNSSPKQNTSPKYPSTPIQQLNLPFYCPNCSVSLTASSPDPQMSLGRLGSPATISPIIKPGQLAHPLPPTEGSNTESTCCIPSQVVTAALLSNRVSGAVFVVFRRKTRTSVAILPTGSRGIRSSTTSEVAAAVQSGASSSTALTPRAGPMRLLNPTIQQQAWDVISGHSFTITHYGSILYRGRERALESTFVSNWLSDKGSLQRLEYLNSSKKEYRFALFGPGNHTSSYKTFDQCNGKGTWRRLLGEPDDDVGREGKSTHIVFMQLSELLAQMVALGVKASELVGCLKQGEYGTLSLDFEPGEWTTPEEREGEHEGLQDKTKEWKKGWWYTERQGMGVWIS